jgi:hypothetical protein
METYRPPESGVDDRGEDGHRVRASYVAQNEKLT